MKVILIDKETNIVNGITYLQSLEEVSSNSVAIEIEENDVFDYMWRKYDFEEKTFSEETYRPKIEERKIQPSETEQIKEQLLAIQEYMVESEFNNLKDKGGLK